MDYEICKGLGYKLKAKLPENYRKIRVHFVPNVKNSRCYKSIIVAYFHLTNAPFSRIYSSIALLKGI